MLGIRFSQIAKDDLEQIWLYTISRWGVNQAQKYTSTIEKSIRSIQENPCIGAARPDIKDGYRVLQVEKHLIFYTVSSEYIDVLGIPHLRMDAKKHF